MRPVTRRRFLVLTGGTVLVACTPDTRGAAPATGVPSSSATTSTTSTSTTSTTTVTTIADPDPAGSAADRVLVLVQLNGGNDGLNTLVPLDGRYHDARPTLGIADEELVALRGFDGVGAHPSLAPLAPLADAGALAAVHGVGFADPDRSHFVSMDRWWRADRLDQPAGWLGRWLDGLSADPGPLDAVALGSPARVAVGEQRVATAVVDAERFALPDVLAPSTLAALTDPRSGSALHAAAQAALAQAGSATDEFAALVGAVDPSGDDDRPSDRGAARRDVSAALGVAARLVSGSPTTRVIVVSTGGYDTHADQAATHAALLDDLATGMAELMATLEASGDRERVLVLTTSEFGRRVAENASGGTDHGAAGVSLLVGDAVEGGLHGAVDLDPRSLVDGDLAPVVDPRVMFTAALDWLGADVEPILGRRHDDITLLRPL